MHKIDHSNPYDRWNGLDALIVFRILTQVKLEFILVTQVKLEFILVTQVYTLVREGADRKKGKIRGEEENEDRGKILYGRR